jgi:hypothetical protein
MMIIAYMIIHKEHNDKFFESYTFDNNMYIKGSI